MATNQSAAAAVTLSLLLSLFTTGRTRLELSDILRDRAVKIVNYFALY